MGDEDGLNASATSFALPRSTITLMKNASTTATDTSARVSCTRVEICTPKYRTTKIKMEKTRLHPQTGNGDFTPMTPGTDGSGVKIVSWTYPPTRTPRPASRTMVPL